MAYSEDDIYYGKKENKWSKGGTQGGEQLQF